MKLKHYVWAAFALATLPVMAEEKDGYKFNTVVQQKTTPVKDQAISGTCWCFTHHLVHRIGTAAPRQRRIRSLRNVHRAPEIPESDGRQLPAPRQG